MQPLLQHLLTRQSPRQQWHQHTFRAMGSRMTVWLETVSTPSKLFRQVVQLFDQYERALSRFDPASELSRLNARAGEWVTVSELLWAPLQAAVGMAAVTDGRFDPTILRALQAAGYRDSFAEMAPICDSDWHRPVGSWADLQLDESRRAVRLPAGMGIDLGGIGKGFTAQLAVESLRADGPCLIDAGGDLVAGAAPDGLPGWPVAIGAPETLSGGEPFDLARLWLAEAALATSGVDHRRWLRDEGDGGQKQLTTAHHLIDPGNGRSAHTDALAVTILADDMISAETWATATMVAGAAGMETLADLDLAALCIRHDGTILLTAAMQEALQAA